VPTADQLPAQTLELVRQVNQQDIALYTFAQERFAQQCAQQGSLFPLRVRWFQFQNKTQPALHKLRTYSIRNKVRTLLRQNN
jgi:hypothetical protein